MLWSTSGGTLRCRKLHFLLHGCLFLSLELRLVSLWGVGAWHRTRDGLEPSRVQCQPCSSLPLRRRRNHILQVRGEMTGNGWIYLHSSPCILVWLVLMQRPEGGNHGTDTRAEEWDNQVRACQVGSILNLFLLSSFLYLVYVFSLFSHKQAESFKCPQNWFLGYIAQSTVVFECRRKKEF